MYDKKQLVNKVILGDSFEELKKVPDETIDMIFADPPYFMGTEGVLHRTDGSKFKGVEDSWDKFSNYNEYDLFSYNWLKECRRVLKKDGTIWVIGSFQNIYRLGFIMQNLGFWILNDVIWSKPNAVPNFSGSRFQNSHETLLWCSKSKKAKYTFNYKTMKHLNGGKQEKSVWDISICIGSERLKGEDGKKIHSTQKPEKLLYNIILSSTKPGDLVLDPFFGTGTTGAVAKQLGRNYVGIDNVEKYVTAAKERIDKIVPVNDDITKGALETKPPKVPMSQLIKEELLKPSQKLYNANKTVCDTIMEDGRVSDGIDILSIHKMSAKHLQLSNNNGWDYYWVEDESRGFIALNQLRYISEELKHGQ